jgi:hypothetical protein
VPLRTTLSQGRQAGAQAGQLVLSKKPLRHFLFWVTRDGRVIYSTKSHNRGMNPAGVTRLRRGFGAPRGSGIRDQERTFYRSARSTRSAGACAACRSIYGTRSRRKGQGSGIGGQGSVFLPSGSFCFTPCALRLTPCTLTRVGERSDGRPGDPPPGLTLSPGNRRVCGGEVTGSCNSPVGCSEARETP